MFSDLEIAQNAEMTPIINIAKAIGLTEDELELLKDHGFLVTERIRALFGRGQQETRAFGIFLMDVWWKDLPVFISTDLILHAFHYSYDVFYAFSELLG